MKTRYKIALSIIILLIITPCCLSGALDDLRQQDTLNIEKYLTQAESLKTTEPARAKEMVINIDFYVEMMDFMNYRDTFGTRIDVLKKELGVSWWDTFSLTEFVSPTEHKVWWGIYVLVPVLLFVFLRIKKRIKRKKMLASATDAEKILHSLESTKKMFEDIEKNIAEKGEHIKKNMEYIDEMKKVIEYNEITKTAKNYPALYSSEKLMKNWAKDILDQIEKRNKKIKEILGRIQQFTEKELPEEEKQLFKTAAMDAEKIDRMIKHEYEVVGEGVFTKDNRTITQNYRNYLAVLTDVAKGQKAINDTLKDKILPYQRYIYSYFRALYYHMSKEENSVEAEHKIVDALKTKKVGGPDLKASVDLLIEYARKKKSSYDEQSRRHEEFARLIKEDTELIEWVRRMELTQESRLKMTLKEADIKSRVTAGSALLDIEAGGRRLKIKIKAGEAGKVKEISSLNELYGIIGPEYIGDDSFKPLLIKKEDEDRIEKEFKDFDKKKRDIEREIRVLENQLKTAIGKGATNTIAVEDQIAAKREEIETIKKYHEKAKAVHDDAIHRNYPHHPLNDIGAWLLEEFRHHDEYAAKIRPVAIMIGRLGYENLNYSRSKMIDYLKKYFPHLT
jgi:hypothetical protein